MEIIKGDNLGGRRQAAAKSRQPEPRAAQNGDHKGRQSLGDETAATGKILPPLPLLASFRPPSLASSSLQFSMQSAVWCEDKPGPIATLRTFECKKKAMAFESNQKLRQEELEAIEKASEIIAGKDVSKAEKHLKTGGAESL